MSPFLPINKRLLNKDIDDNNETIEILLSGKYDMSHTSPDGFTEKITKILQIMMTKTRGKLRKFGKIMKLLMILKLQIFCVMIVLSRQPKKKKHLFNG